LCSILERALGEAVRVATEHAANLLLAELSVPPFAIRLPFA
jgi:hypothetical protein